MRKGEGTSGQTRSTVQYGVVAPKRALGGGAATFGSAHSTKGTFVAAPLTKMVQADRGQALVPCAQVGPVRPPRDNKPGNNPMGGTANYKTAFKTPGCTNGQGSSAVDVAHLKGMKGRFSDAFTYEIEEPKNAATYGCIAGSQFGKVQRPQSAGRMLGFQNVCSTELPPRPCTATRDRDMVLQDAGVHLDNVLARAGI